MKKGANESRKLLGIIIILFWASEYFYVSYFTSHMSDIGLTSSIIGLATGFYGLSQLVLRVPIGIITDKKNAYKFMVIFGCLMSAVASIGLLLFDNAFGAVVFRFFAGIGSSTWLAFTVLYSAYYKAGENVSAMSNVTGYNNAGKLLAFLLGTLFVTIWNYESTLIGSAVLGVAGAVLATRLGAVPISEKPVSIRGLLGVLGNRFVLLPAVLCALQQFMSQSTIYSFTANHSKLLGASSTQLGISSVIITGVQVVLAPVVGKKIAPKIGANKTIVLGFALLTIYPIMLIFAPGMWFIYIAQVVAGLGSLLTYAILMAKSIEHIELEKKSTAMGAFQAIYGLGMTLGPIISGLVVTGEDYTPAFILCAGVTAVAGLAAAFLLPANDRAARSKQ